MAITKQIQATQVTSAIAISISLVSTNGTLDTQQSKVEVCYTQTLIAGSNVTVKTLPVVTKTIAEAIAVNAAILADILAIADAWNPDAIVVP